MSREFIVIGLLSVLFLFKRTRYASFIYLVAFVSYYFSYSKGLIPDEYYFEVSATINTFIFLALFKGYKCSSINDIFTLQKYNTNQKVGLLSVLLVVINFVGFCRYNHNDVFDPSIYNSDYRFIEAVQISLLYVGNMFNAWMDRRDYKRAMVRLVDIHYFEATEESNTKEIKG